MMECLLSFNTFHFIFMFFQVSNNHNIYVSPRKPQLLSPQVHPYSRPTKVCINLVYLCSPITGLYILTLVYIVIYQNSPGQHGHTPRTSRLICIGESPSKVIWMAPAFCLIIIFSFSLTIYVICMIQCYWFSGTPPAHVGCAAVPARSTAWKEATWPAYGQAIGPSPIANGTVKLCRLFQL